MAYRYPTTCPSKAEDVIDYLKHQSLADEELEAGQAEVSAWGAESNGWSPYELERDTLQNLSGWPVCLQGVIRNTRTGQYEPIVVERCSGQLRVWFDGDVEWVETMKAAMDYVRAQLVRPLATAA